MVKNRLRLTATCLLALLLLTAHPRAAAAQQTSNSPPGSPSHGAVIDQYCVTCHNDRLRTAGVVLAGLDLSNVSADAETWERVVRKLRTREMPPAGQSRPEEATYDALTRQITTALDRAADAAPDPGRGPLHRLNRTEYANVIRDLLALEFDVSRLLPPDDSSYGFDNVADALTVSPLLMEQYLAAAQKISRAAVGSLAIRPITEMYRTAIDHTQDYHLDGLPFGTRGGHLVRHYFPLDAEYEIRGRLTRQNSYGSIRGLAEPHDIAVIVDGRRVALFNVGGPDMDDQISVSTVTAGDGTADEILRVRVPVTAGYHSVAVTFLERPRALIQDLQRPFLASFRSDRGPAALPHVDRITVSGPYDPTGPGDTPSRRRIFECRPDDAREEAGCARTIISTLARRAYRRPVTDTDIDVLLPFYTMGHDEGGFEVGIETVLRRILVGPEFIFRAEYDPADIAPDTAYPVSNLELASRLSFFLWSSAPDDELLEVAARGTLRDPRVLEQQTRRMLNDPRSAALVDNFAGQWLHLRNVSSVQPTPSEFPDFDENLRQAFGRETALFVESIIREDRSVIDLLDADYTFVNERLARHYGIPNVYGDRFRRIRVTDEHRRGLFGHGSVLTVTSHADRTSPVLRGKWILENILGSPPPPPPPDVPELVEAAPGQVLAMRERMEQHRKNPVCASCHVLMDPLGLALENFDATGQWRTSEGRWNSYEGTTTIDASVSLADGTTFAGPAGLRDWLLSRREEFATTVTSKLLTYALGRGVEYYDAPTIRTILRESEDSEYAFSAILTGIIKSVPFQMRRSAPASVTSTASRATR